MATRYTTSFTRNLCPTHLSADLYPLCTYVLAFRKTQYGVVLSFAKISAGMLLTGVWGLMPLCRG